MNPLEIGWVAGAQPGYQGDAISWLAEHVRLPHSARSTSFDPTLAPWLNAIIRAVCDDRVKQIVMRFPTGAGKTSLLELLCCWIVANQPGPMLMTEQTDETSKDWAESRLLPTLAACEPVARLFPADRHAKRKTSIMFPHMALFLGGANMSGAQGKSMRYVWADECWQYRPGMLGELAKRLHDRWNRKMLICSQGWDESHETEEFWRMGRVHEWGHICAACGAWVLWAWNNFRYDEPKEEGGEWVWSDLRASVHYVCPECQHVTPNSVGNRRAMAAASSYRDVISNSIEGCVSFTLPACAIWWIDWADLAVEWVKANIQKRKGNIEPLKQFLTKRLAQTWKDAEEAPEINLLAADYAIADYENGQKIEGEVARFLTVDVQQDHYWALVRAWNSGGGSRLLYYRKAFSFEELRELQRKYDIRDNMVFIDSGYEAGTVYELCARVSKYNNFGWINSSGWWALKGDQTDRFAHNLASGRVERFYSPYIQVAAANGRHCRFCRWSNLIAKDKLSALRASGPEHWGFPRDIGPEYMAQVTAEVKKDVVDKTTKAIVRRYVPIRRDNHAWDCEAMQVVAASITKILTTTGDDAVNSTPSIE